MKRVLCFFILVLWSFNVSANISLSPYYLELGDGAGRTAQLRFTNSSQSEKTYDINVVNFKQEKDGAYTPINDPLPGNPFAAPYLEWSPHQVTLQPGQSQVVRVRRRAMAAAPVGEYVSHMLIREQPDAANMYGGEENKKNGLTINLKPLYGVSIPVMILHGPLNSSARIDNIKITSRAGVPIASVAVSRSGDRSFFGSLIVRQGRRELGRISNFRIFMTTPLRVVDIPLTAVPSGDVTVTLIDENANETLETKSI